MNMDIYDDLDNYNEGANIEALQSENQELKCKLQEYETAMQKLQKDHDNLVAEHKSLLANFSALLKTARAEIERKTQTIMQINAEKDQMILRLVNNGNTRGINQLRHGDFNKTIKSSDSTDVVITQKDEKIATARPVPDVNQRLTEKSLEPYKIPKKSNSNTQQQDYQSRDLRNSPDLRGKENQKSKPLSISCRRKSMPAFRCEEVPKFSTSEEELSETPKSITPSSIDDKEDHRERSSGSSYDPRGSERERNKYESMRKKDRRCSDRERPRRRSRELELNALNEQAYKRSQSRHRPDSPNDRYSRNKSRDRRSDLKNLEYDRRMSQGRRTSQERRRSKDRILAQEVRISERGRSRERRRDNRAEKFPTQESQDRRLKQKRRLSQERRSSQEKQTKQKMQEDRELNAKRRKVECVTDNFSRWGRSYDSPMLPFKSQDDLPTSCQSPDENFVERPNVGHNIREIKFTALTKLEDPRYQSSRYIKVADKNSKPVLASVAARHVDLQVLRWDENADKPEQIENTKEIPKDLIEPPQQVETTDNEKLVQDIYNDIDVDVDDHNASMESGEIVDKDISEDLLFRPTVEEPMPKASKEIKHASKEPPTYNTDLPKTDKNHEVPIEKYRIPKKKAIVHETKKGKAKGDGPLDLLYKQFKSDDKNSSRKLKSNELPIANTEILTQNESKKEFRDIVEGDLALSDDDNSHGKITDDSKNINHYKDILENKSKNNQVEEKHNDAKNKTDHEQSDKSKDIKARFSDLFGDSSLITPEDLDIPSETVPTEICVLALSDNANLVGENESWSITNESFNKKDISVVEETFETEKSHKSEKKQRIDTIDEKLNQGIEIDSSNLEKETITLIPETAAEVEKDVIKTVLISSGVQPQNVIIPQVVEKVAAMEKEEPIVRGSLALATSTPLRLINNENPVVTDTMIIKKGDESDNMSQNLTTSLSESTTGTPDVRIILKRKKRVLKKI